MGWGGAEWVPPLWWRRWRNHTIFRILNRRLVPLRYTKLLVVIVFVAVCILGRPPTRWKLGWWRRSLVCRLHNPARLHDLVFSGRPGGDEREAGSDVRGCSLLCPLTTNLCWKCATGKCEMCWKFPPALCERLIFRQVFTGRESIQSTSSKAGTNHGQTRHIFRKMSFEPIH